MRAVQFIPPPILAKPTPKLAENFPNWTNLEIQKIFHVSNFGQIGRNSAKNGGRN
jgi:hypothetical protein